MDEEKKEGTEQESPETTGTESTEVGETTGSESVPDTTESTGTEVVD